MASLMQPPRPERIRGSAAQEERRALLWALLRELDAGAEDFELSRACAKAGVEESYIEEEFGSLEAALRAAGEQLRGELVRRARGLAPQGSGWTERVRIGLTAILETTAEHPDIARVMSGGTAGALEGQPTQTELLDGLAALLGEGRSEGSAELPEEVELLAVGAAESLIFAEVEAGRAQQLPRMTPQILFSLLVPFLGPERAGEEMRGGAAQP
jgi:hypothetical protein